MRDYVSDDHVRVLEALTSTHRMVADYDPFRHDFLGRVATRIVNEVKGDQPSGV